MLHLLLSANTQLQSKEALLAYFPERILNDIEYTLRTANVTKCGAQEEVSAELLIDLWHPDVNSDHSWSLINKPSESQPHKTIACIHHGMLKWWQ